MAEEKSSEADKEATQELYRNPEDGMLGGVCQGISEVYDVDVNLCRILAFLFAVPYIVAWLILPEKGEIEDGS